MRVSSLVLLYRDLPQDNSINSSNFCKNSLISRVFLKFYFLKAYCTLQPTYSTFQNQILWMLRQFCKLFSLGSLKVSLPTSPYETWFRYITVEVWFSSRCFWTILKMFLIFLYQFSRPVRHFCEYIWGIFILLLAFFFFSISYLKLDAYFCVLKIGERKLKVSLY